MSFTGRTYPDIVGDILTNLTQGVTGERHAVVYESTERNAVPVDIALQRRPVRRVSRVTGAVSTDGGQTTDPVDFTAADYELVATGEDPADRSTLRFLPFAPRKPAPGSEVVVNYYPRTTDPTVLTDVQPGSVVRTLVEAVSKELAVLYGQLDAAYDSAFLETATGSSLDRVVALLGYRRYRAGRPVGLVRFGRRTGSVGDVTIPAGTPITDSRDKIRYETAENRTMLAGESTAEVRVRGATDATPVVKSGELAVIQRSIAGVDTVTNERPTTTASADESDVELRARARSALLAASKGTLPAIEHGLLQLPQVRSVKVLEAPNGVAGEISVSVDVTDGAGPGLPPEVLERIEELRPAGVRVIAEQSGALTIAANVALVLAGSSMARGDRDALHRSVARSLVKAVSAIGVGQPVRNGRLVAAILSDQRIVDATLRLGEEGKPPLDPGADLDPGGDRAARLPEGGVTLAADRFEAAATPAGAPVSVEVRATVAATPKNGAAGPDITAQIHGRLEGYLKGLRPTSVMTIADILAALRDDAAYQVDPLGLRLALHAGDQFIQLSQGGPSFTVGVTHRLVLISVDVTP